jgi:signal transduction histidine kinase/PAS domain-containing protein
VIIFSQAGPMLDGFRSAMERPLLRCAITIGAVSVSFLLRYELVHVHGLALPPFITYFPAIVLVALLAGFWSGVLATALTVIGMAFLSMPVFGHGVVEEASDAVALVLYAGVGVFTCLLAEYYRRGQMLISDFKMKQALQEGELLYRNLFNSMEEGFCVIQMLFDPQGNPIDFRYIEVNAAFEQQTGFHDAVGKRIREFAPDIEQYWFDLYGKVALTGEPAHVVDEAKAMNRSFEVRVFRVGDPQLRQVAVVFNEISERRRTEAHIRRLNRVYAVLSDINETIVRVKDSGAMLEAACHIAVEKGKFRMAWIGMIDGKTHVVEPIAFSGLVDGYLDRVKIDLRDPDHGTGPAARCIQSGAHAICNDIEHDLYRPWKDEAIRNGYRSVAAFPLRVDNKTVGVFSLYASELAFFDDDETKLLDEMAMDMSFAMEVDRNENARRQLEEQFRQAQKMEAIGQLTGGIAHDFNNLLTVILGCSEVLGDELKENPQLSKMAEMIAGAAQQGAELTHRMLAFARRQPLQARPVNVIQLLDGMQNFLRRTLSEQIDLHLIQGCKDCDALVDPTQLESALLNLCVNARDAMPDGGTITIETGNVALDRDYAEQNHDVTPGQYILIAVSDSGFGISREYLEHVFEPFFTTKATGKGTGLGLSMVYGFIKQSQGHVKIYSEPGHGTSVKLYLPVANRESEPATQTHTPIADPHGTEVILLVEDNESVREFAKLQLTGLGYHVLEACNGKDALKVISERTDVELLFTDIVMPGGLNGRELALEACRINSKLKVLYSSGYAENAILHEGLLDKDVQFLSKPYTRRELAARIRELLAAS